MFETRPLDLSEKGIEEIQKLLNTVFPAAAHLSKEYLTWQYVNNPIGQAVGANVYDEEKLIAHFVSQPLRSLINGVEEKALLTLNIATHPDYRGRGLFKQAGLMTLELAKEQGYGHMIGVPNANSTKAFVKHLKFDLLGSLEVKMGFGHLAQNERSEACHYEVLWQKKDLEWRLARPGQNYIKTTEQGQQKIHVFDKGFYVELASTYEEVDVKKAGVGFTTWPLRLWLGFDDSRDWKGLSYINMPEFLKPSPLNFIFYDFSEEKRTLNKKEIRFQALDFDPF